MKCGIGKCGRCNIGPVYVCKDGPVFTARAAGEAAAGVLNLRKGEIRHGHE